MKFLAPGLIPLCSLLEIMVLEFHSQSFFFFKLRTFPLFLVEKLFY